MLLNRHYADMFIKVTFEPAVAYILVLMSQLIIR